MTMAQQSHSYQENLVGVFGYPVAENPTCLMQQAAFDAAGLKWRYLTIEVQPEQLADAMRGLRALNMRGINLTIPHKVAVIEHLDELAPEAELIGAVNTVVNDHGRLVGHNTDGKGFLRSLREDAGIDPRGRRVVFLGAGGAARAMATELALAGVGHITIANRTPARGQELAARLRDRCGVAADFTPWQGDYVVPSDAHILINATSVGLFPNLTATPAVDTTSIRPDLLVCDVIPNPPQTAFLTSAGRRGARTLDGLGMLVYQGAIAFRMWTDSEPSIHVMRHALENVFGG
jgi:shikimate dehydrogenase